MAPATKGKPAPHAEKKLPPRQRRSGKRHQNQKDRGHDDRRARRDGSRSGTSSKSSSSSSSSPSAQKKPPDVVAKEAEVVIINDGPPTDPSPGVGGAVAAAKVVEDVGHSKLGVRELKELLTAAGVSFAGATEKEDLVRLLTKARAQAATNHNKFVATEVWQLVPDGVALPPGLEVRFDMAKGGNYARIPQAKK